MFSRLPHRWVDNSGMRHLVWLATTVSLLTPVAAAPIPLLDEDARLTGAVTLKSRATPLSDALARLSSDSGVALRADGDIALEPVVLWVTGQPLREVMRQVASLYDYRWQRSAGGADGSYLLAQTVDGRKAESALRARHQEQLLGSLRAEVRLRLELLRRGPEVLATEVAEHEAAAARFGELSDTERRAVSSTPTYRQTLARAGHIARVRELLDPVRGSLTRLASGFTPSQWDSLLRGEALRFTSRKAALGAGLPRPISEELAGTRHAWLPRGEQTYRVPGTERSAPEGGFSFTTRSLLADPWGFEVLAVVEQQADASVREGTLVIRVSALLPSGTPLEWPARLQISAALPPELPAPAAPPVEKAANSRLGALPPADFPVSPPSAEAPGAWFSAALPRIAEAYGLQLVADGYRAQRMLQPPALGGRLPLYQVLNSVVRPNASWELDGGFLRVRRHFWHTVRRGEVEAATVERWKRRLEGASVLSLEDAALLAHTLGDAQLGSFEALMRESGIALRGFDSVIRSRAVLRAYAALPAALRARLLAGRSVHLSELPLAARRHLGAALNEWLREQVPLPPAGSVAVGELSLEVPEPPTGPAAGAVRQRAAPPVRFTYRHSDALSATFNVRLPLLREEPAAAVVPGGGRD